VLARIIETHRWIFEPDVSFGFVRVGHENERTTLHPLFTAFSKHFRQTRQEDLEPGHYLLLTFWGRLLTIAVTTSYKTLYAELRSNGVGT